jgi:hypothetical protein
MLDNNLELKKQIIHLVFHIEYLFLLKNIYLQIKYQISNKRYQKSIRFLNNKIRY